MRVLVTGGAGFIGSHIAQHYVRRGHEVRVVDNLHTGHRRNLGEFADELHFVEGDVRDADCLVELAQGCELIYHQAAIVSVPYSVDHPQETHDVNIQGTLNVLEAAKKRGVRRVVFACSAAVYGDNPKLPLSEAEAPAPQSPYGIEKITGEYYLKVFNALYGVETVSLRYFNVFGPRQDPKSPYSGVISIFVDRARAGQPLTIFGDGQQSRDFVFVDDVVQANVLAGSVTEAAGHCYNIGCGKQTSLNELVKALEQVLGRQIALRMAEARQGDIKHSLADISRARQELGYAPKIEVHEGLQQLLASIA